jgi:AraC-like DNA-binding protein
VSTSRPAPSPGSAAAPDDGVGGEARTGLRLRPTTDPRSGICRYEIRADDPSSLEFEIRGLHGYYDRYRANMTRPHRHAFDQILWFEQPGRHHVDFAEYRHGANALFFIARDQIHHFEQDVVPEGWLLHFNAAYLGGAFPARVTDLIFHLFDSFHRSPMIQPDGDDLRELAALIRLIEAEYTRPDGHADTDIAMSLLSALLIAAHRCKAAAERPSSADARRDARLFLEFKALLDREFAAAHGVEPYAAALGVRPWRLSEVCHAMTGRTAKQLIMERVVLEAKRCLAYSDLSIAEVGARVGFADALYFSRVFKRRAELSPSAFRATLPR